MAVRFREGNVVKRICRLTGDARQRKRTIAELRFAERAGELAELGLQERFDSIYSTNLWSDPASRSGVGSTLDGHPPLVMDLKTGRNDVDHLVALFRVRGYWGGITKTNHAALRYREPIFRGLRKLAASYFHEYTLPDGRKTLRSYSAPFDLRRYAHDWTITEEPLWDLESRIDQSRHYKLLNRRQIAGLRRADNIEIQAGKLIEWR